jgi:hypothetical protein
VAPKLEPNKLGRLRGSSREDKSPDYVILQVHWELGAQLGRQLHKNIAAPSSDGMETLYEEGRKGERRNEKMTQKQLHMPFCNINVPLAKRSESLRRFFPGSETLCVASYHAGCMQKEARRRSISIQLDTTEGPSVSKASPRHAHVR